MQLIVSRFWKAISPIIAFLSFGLVSGMLFADEVVLRNLEILKDVTIVAFDEDGIRLSDDRSYSLDLILSASCAEQERFNELHSKISDPLFRVLVRVRKKDFENLEQQLKLLGPIFANRTSRSAALVNFAQFNLHTRYGHSCLAIDTYFRLFRLASVDPALGTYLGSLGFSFEKSSGQSKEIRPFGFDRKRILENWDSILAAYRSLPPKHPSGLDFYFFSLVSAGEVDLDAETASHRIQLDPLDKILIDNLSVAVASDADNSDVQQAFVRQTGFRMENELSNIRQALFLYSGGKLLLRSGRAGENEGLLKLLKIHAAYEDTAPAIAAAALFDTYSTLSTREPPKDSENVREELLSRYPSSDFAIRLRMKR